MAEPLEKPESSKWRWVLVGAAIGGIIVPAVAMTVSPLIPTGGLQLPAALLASFLPGAFISGFLFALLNNAFPAVDLVGLVFGSSDSDIPWLFFVFCSPVNAAIYGFVSYILWWGTHGKPWLLPLFGIPIGGSWLIFIFTFGLRVV